MGLFAPRGGFPGSQLDRFADHNQRRRADLFAFDQVGHGAERRVIDLLVRPRDPADHGHGRVGRTAAAHERLAPLPCGTDPHIEHERPGKVAQLGIVQRRAAHAVGLMAGDQRHGRSRLAMRERYARVAEHGRRRCYPGDHLERDPRGGQGFRLFGPAAKDGRIAALQPHHRPPRTSRLDHPLIDFRLGHRSPAVRTSQTDDLGRSPGVT